MVRAWLTIAAVIVLVSAAQAQRAPFRGDIASWSGVPSPPPSALDQQTATSSTRCTVSDTTGRMVVKWTTSADCLAWGRAAMKLAETGPSPAEVYQFRISRCTAAVSQRVSQTASGEFAAFCARVVPAP